MSSLGFRRRAQRKREKGTCVYDDISVPIVYGLKGACSPDLGAQVGWTALSHQVWHRLPERHFALVVSYGDGAPTDDIPIILYDVFCATRGRRYRQEYRTLVQEQAVEQEDGGRTVAESSPELHASTASDTPSFSFAQAK